jgi:Holliday junction resolvase RusA-like endonuclease
MSKIIRITIQTEPVAKARSRVVFNNGKIHSYTLPKTKNAQDLIRLRCMRHQDSCFGEHIPVKLTVVFYRTKSKWLPRKETMPFRKSDLDNYIKTVMDAINGVLVADDAAITTILARKRWSTTGHGFITLKLQEDRINALEK